MSHHPDLKSKACRRPLSRTDAKRKTKVNDSIHVSKGHLLYMSTSGMGETHHDLYVLPEYFPPGQLPKQTNNNQST